MNPGGVREDTEYVNTVLSSSPQMFWWEAGPAPFARWFETSVYEKS